MRKKAKNRNPSKKNQYRKKPSSPAVLSSKAATTGNHTNYNIQYEAESRQKQYLIIKLSFKTISNH
jgi:hypothetical protein